MNETKRALLVPLVVSLFLHLILFAGLSLNFLWPKSVSANKPVSVRIVSINLPKPKENIPPNPDSRFISNANRKESGEGKPADQPKLRREMEERLPARQGENAPEVATLARPPSARLLPAPPPPEPAPAEPEIFEQPTPEPVKEPEPEVAVNPEPVKEPEPEVAVKTEPVKEPEPEVAVKTEPVKEPAPKVVVKPEPVKKPEPKVVPKVVETPKPEPDPPPSPWWRKSRSPSPGNPPLP